MNSSTAVAKKTKQDPASIQRLSVAFPFCLYESGLKEMSSILTNTGALMHARRTHAQSQASSVAPPTVKYHCGVWAACEMNWRGEYCTVFTNSHQLPTEGGDNDDSEDCACAGGEVRGTGSAITHRASGGMRKQKREISKDGGEEELLPSNQSAVASRRSCSGRSAEFVVRSQWGLTKSLYQRTLQGPFNNWVPLKHFPFKIWNLNCLCPCSCFLHARYISFVRRCNRKKKGKPAADRDQRAWTTWRSIAMT